MKNLLFLVHRLPYPPDKGDKITSHHMLKYLSRRFNLHLGCFIDDPNDWRHLDRVRQYCSELHAAPLNPRAARFLSLRGLLTGEPLSLPYYRHRGLQRWVDKLLERKRIDSILVFSGPMAQYVAGRLTPAVHSVLDLEDVDSDKWRLFAEDHPWPLNRILLRESRQLLAFERAMAGQFDTTLFVSRKEAELFQRLAPEVQARVRHRVQGVDSHYFDPARNYPDPYQGNRKVLVFTGAMDYWPNIDAVVWFVREVLPLIRRREQEAHFCIVGRNPSRSVRALAADPAVTVTGAVPDVRPYLAHAACAALPLRIARGIQNKILEAMAMEKPVLATPEAMHGLQLCPEFAPAVAGDAEELADRAIELLATPHKRHPGSRACALRHYDWERNMERVQWLLRGSEAGKPPAAATAKRSESNWDAHSSHS